MQIGNISKRERNGTDSNWNNIFLQLLLKMPKLEPKQLTRNQQRELDRKQKAKREKANRKKSKQRSRLTEDMKELERDKDRRRRSRSRERKCASKKEVEVERARCALMSSCVPVVQTETLQTEMLPPGMTAEKKDPVAGYPKLSQVGLPPPLILNYIRGVPLPGKVSL